MKNTPFDKHKAGATHAAPAPQRVSAPGAVVKFIALVLCCLMAAACGELRAAGDADRPATVTIAGSPIPVPSSGSPDDIIQVGIDGSASDQNQRQELLTDLVQVVLPEAARRKSLVVTDVVGSNGFNAGGNLSQVDFKAALSSETVDATTLTTAAFNEVVASLTRALAGAAPSSGSDPLGFLLRLSETRAQFPKAHLLGVYLGDGGQSTKGCDLALSPVTPDSSLKATEKSCLAGLPLRLSGVDVWLIGIGAATASGGMTPAQAITAKTFLTEIVRSVGGTVSQATAHPIAGGG
jgi:hypothetical protein